MPKYTPAQLTALHDKLTAARDAVAAILPKPRAGKELDLFTELHDGWDEYCILDGPENEKESGEIMHLTNFEATCIVFAAADPRTGLLASIDRDIAHVEDHMAALDEANQFWDTWAGRDPTEINEAPPPGPAGMQIHTARLWAHYMEEANGTDWY